MISIRTDITIPSVPVPDAVVSVDVAEGTPHGRSLALAVAQAAKDGRPLSGRDLRGADFGGLCIERMRIDGSDLTDASFKGATLKHCDLSGCILSGTSFAGADIERTSMERTTLHGADFSDALLSFVNLSQSTGEGTTFAKASIVDVDMSGSRLVSPSFENCAFARLAAADLHLASPNLSGCSVVSSVMPRTEFAGATSASGPFFVSTSDLTDAAFTDCDLPQMEMDGVIAPGSSFDKVHLAGGRLNGCSFATSSFAEFSAKAVTFRTVDAASARFLAATLHDCDIDGLNASRSSGTDLLLSGGSVTRLILGASTVVRVAAIDLERLSESSFKEARFEDLRIDRTVVEGCDFDGMATEAMSLHECDVSLSTFEGSRLGLASLKTARIDDAACLRNATWDVAKVPPT